jgi:hypothetical protein
MKRTVSCQSSNHIHHTVRTVHTFKEFTILTNRKTTASVIVMRLTSPLKANCECNSLIIIR